MNSFYLALFLITSPLLCISQRFAVIGDYGLDGAGELSVANLVKSWNPEFIITVGDNNYPDGYDSTIDKNIGKYYGQYIYPYSGNFTFSEPFGDTANRFFPSLGNHDLNTNSGQAYLDYFTLPTAYPGNERYYTFTRGSVQLIALNSDPAPGHEPDGNSSSSLQAFWMLGAIAGNNAPWKIAYFHHPPYSSGSGHGSHSWMQWPFDSWGITAVIAGHDHTYERLMDGNFPYFVNGLGGKSIYGFNTPLPESVVRYNGSFGAMLVTANADSIQFCFHTVTDSIVDCHTVYNSSGIEANTNEIWFNVFPNPCIEILEVGTSEKGELEIFNVLGEKIKQWTVAIGRNKIETGSLSKGIYLLRMITEKGVVEKTIVKE